MALLTKRRRRIQSRETPPAEAPPPPRPVRRRRRWAVPAVLVLTTLLWLLPTIVAHTPLLHWILAKATAELNGTVTVESASLGWFSPVVARQIEVSDARGEPVLQAARLTGSRSLAAILWNRSNLGQFRLEQPKLIVSLRDDGSNVEDLLADYLAPGEETRRVSLVLETDDGSVTVTDQGGRRTWRIEGVQLSLSTSADAGGPLELETSATLPDPQHPGRFAVGMTLGRHGTEDGPPTTPGKLTVESQDVPLEMFQSLVGRFMPETRLVGRLRGEIRAQWGGQRAAGETVVQADVTAEDLGLSMPALGTDRVDLERAHAVCKIAWQEGRLEIGQATVDCDLGNASVEGTLELGDRQSGSLLGSALYQTHEINGRIDLARLARVLPGTLRIRKEAQITSGQVQLALSSRRGPQGMVWRGRIEAGDLEATYRGRQLAWRRPILVTLAAHEGQQGPVVESLKCESDFLQLHAAGTPQELAASASFDLSELADQLGQFVDLGGIGLAGDGWANLNWKRSEKDRFEADAELQVRDFQLAMPPHRGNTATVPGTPVPSGGQTWTEKNLLVFLSASGRTDLGSDTQLDAASLEIKTATERIEAKLTQPVSDLHGGGTWPVDVQAQGQLQTWPPRLATWIALERWTLGGAYELSAQATASIDAVSVPHARLAVQQLRLQTPSLNVKEPKAELTFSGRWDRGKGHLQIEPARLTSDDLSVQADRVVLTMPEEGPLEMVGSVKYQGNLRRLQLWTAGENAPPGWRLAGRLSGSAELSHSAGVTGAEVDADIGDPVVTLASGTQFRESRVHLVARGGYEHQAQVLRLANVELTSATLGGRGAGQIARRDDRADVQLDGQLQYDLAKLSEWLRPYIGSGVRFSGRGAGPASYRGPLALAEARANGDARWDSASAYGFRVGPGELKATLAGGILRAEPLDLPVSGGRLLLAPRLRLAPEPIELSLPPGPVAQKVQVTPAMCASALQYIAPVLAGVTTAQGSFSIELDGCRIPMADPAKGELAGRLTIHSIQVGPGPLIRELAILLGRATPAKLRRESVVPFRMVDGRVYHRGLELIFPDLTIRTYGSVGLDQSLAIMAEMPVPPKWLGNNVVGSALRNQTIRLPIGGTLSKPKIDQRELDRVSRQLLGNAARNVIEDELNRQLERLLGPPR